MDEVTQKEFDKAAALKPEELVGEAKELTDKDFEKLLEEMQNPVQAQQRLAVQIKNFLDKRIKEEMSKDREEERLGAKLGRYFEREEKLAEREKLEDQGWRFEEEKID